uniref:Uncharacterized protein n=1 Tax=Heterorhabditis bacteriophora TaxID=37862 RepID=A0A1I7X6Z8_HETBA
MAVSFFYFLVTTALISSAEYIQLIKADRVTPKVQDQAILNNTRQDQAVLNNTRQVLQLIKADRVTPKVQDQAILNNTRQVISFSLPINYSLFYAWNTDMPEFILGSSTNQGQTGNSQGSGSGSPQQYPSDYPVYQDQPVGSSSVPSYPDLSYPDDGSGCPPCVPSLPPADTPITDEDIEVSVDSCITALNNLANNSKNKKYADLLNLRNSFVCSIMVLNKLLTQKCMGSVHPCQYLMVYMENKHLCHTLVEFMANDRLLHRFLMRFIKNDEQCHSPEVCTILLSHFYQNKNSVLFKMYSLRVHRLRCHNASEKKGGMYGKRATTPFSGGMYSKRAGIPFSGGMYGKRFVPIPVSGGLYGKRVDRLIRSSMPISGGFFG